MADQNHHPFRVHLPRLAFAAFFSLFSRMTPYASLNSMTHLAQVQKKRLLDDPNDSPTILETSKQLSLTRGTTQIAPASPPIPLFRLQQTLCRNAAYTGRVYLPSESGVLPSGSGATNIEQCFPGLHRPPVLLTKQSAEILSVVAF
jgi:hypothetical protein